MKKILFYTAIFFPLVSFSQIITTIIGNGVRGFSGDGEHAKFASFDGPNSIVIDKFDYSSQRLSSEGNTSQLTGGDTSGQSLGVTIYVSDFANHVIRKISKSGIVTTYAGTGTIGYDGDGGPATAAQLDYPGSLAIDKKGNLYVADVHNHRIRRISSDGIISTYAGGYTSVYSGDGVPATNAGLDRINSIKLDDMGNLFMSDQEGYIRKVDTFGIITTVAGCGFYGAIGDSIPATTARILAPYGIAVDKLGNIYLCSQTYIRKIDIYGIIKTIAGTGYSGDSGDGGPATAASIGSVFGFCIDDKGNILFADYSKSRIRKIAPSGIISTVAGNGIDGYTGDGGLATAAQLNSPREIDIDSDGNLYIADNLNHVVRKITSGTSSINEPVTTIFKVYPNPSSDFLKIVGEEKLDRIRIYNFSGQQVFNFKINKFESEINISDLPPGGYFINVNELKSTTFVKR